MPSLNFKGKALVQNFHLLVPFHELKPVKAKSLTAKPSLHDNLVVHGDNLKALKALLPYYHGAVKCIYIDPPYNTGNEAWVYNDNVNSPRHSWRRLARVSPLLATKRVARMTAFRAVRKRSVRYLDTPVELQLHKQDRPWKQERFMGDTPYLSPACGFGPPATVWRLRGAEHRRPRKCLGANGMR